MGMSFFGKTKNILKLALDCLFPRCCMICNGKVDAAEYCNLCSSCIAQISWIRGGRCSLCSRPMGDMEDAGTGELVCLECKKNMPKFKSGMSCWTHRGIGRDIILTLKYCNADFLKNDIATLLRNHCPGTGPFAANSVLVPVPMCYFRRVGRGYNQSEIIANAIAKIAPNTTVVNMLKSRHKRAQTGLNREGRLANVKNAFRCSSTSANVPKGSRIVLVDDVTTTGATIRGCCEVLHGAGFENLHVLTLSYG
jgi:ComF family protein